MPWNSGGLRGSTLEELVNLTNEAYRSRGLAVVQKIPTPITPVKFDGAARTIQLAYFDQKSTVDYIGAAQGIPICFDAKETGRESLPIQNIHEHQMQFMKEFERQKGIAFLLVHFSKADKYYFLPFMSLESFWDAARKGSRKSIPRDAFDERLIIPNRDGVYIHYLEAINSYLDIKDR
ncbi:MAG: Holliday junction resolvase RecU [Clostridiales bacterium]|jgi:recombination protein U|nr:Holliday junction resolvase RecU [Clostridiales bacterium]